jgi:cobaltochelatase CobN
VNNAVFTSDDTAWLDTLIAALEQRGLNAYAFYGPRQQKDLFFQATHAPTPGTQNGVKRIADVIINAALVFNPTERKAELERIGVPVLQTMPALAMDAAQWAQSRDGLALSDVAYYYTPSELSGMVDALLITARPENRGAGADGVANRPGGRQGRRTGPPAGYAACPAPRGDDRLQLPAR